MVIRFRKSAIKFLRKADPDDVENIRAKLKQLLESIQDQGIIPFTELDIKKMKGEWEGFYRLRIGRIRVIFTVDSATDEIEVYTIGFRGDVYQD